MTDAPPRGSFGDRPSWRPCCARRSPAGCGPATRWCCRVALPVRCVTERKASLSPALAQGGATAVIRIWFTSCSAGHAAQPESVLRPRYRGRYRGSVDADGVRYSKICACQYVFYVWWGYRLAHLEYRLAHRLRVRFDAHVGLMHMDRPVCTDTRRSMYMMGCVPRWT